MNNGALKNYKFGPKNNWRRAVWNRASEMISVPAKEAIVVYLAGAQDMDRKVAIEHGFSDHNLIAIEHDSKVIQGLRRDGKLVIDGDLFSILQNWPSNFPVAVILGDLCSGLEAKWCDGISSISSIPALCNAVFAFNFLRGRDASSNHLRKMAGTKHRGQAILAIAGFHAALAANNAGLSRVFLGKEFQEHIGGFTGTYASDSGNQRFDSAIWRNMSLNSLRAWLYNDVTKQQARHRGLLEKQLNVTESLYSELDSCPPDAKWTLLKSQTARKIAEIKSQLGATVNHFDHPVLDDIRTSLDRESVARIAAIRAHRTRRMA